MRIRRSKNRKHREGMTLIEIMIVVVIMAMMATAAGIGAMKVKAVVDEDMAESGVRRMASVAETYMLQNKGSCPTLEALKNGNYMAKGSNAEDPWGVEYALTCEDGDLSVRSAGEDKQMNTEDDIVL